LQLRRPTVAEPGLLNTTHTTEMFKFKLNTIVMKFYSARIYVIDRKLFTFYFIAG